MAKKDVTVRFQENVDQPLCGIGDVMFTNEGPRYVMGIDLYGREQKDGSTKCGWIYHGTAFLHDEDKNEIAWTGVIHSYSASLINSAKSFKKRPTRVK